MSTLVLKPTVSEKAVFLAKQGQYAFEVPISANKLEVAQAVAEQFKVKVVDVNMLISKGKVKRVRNHPGRQKDRKKAIVQLEAGQKITLFEGAN